MPDDFLMILLWQYEKLAGRLCNTDRDGRVGEWQVDLAKVVRGVRSVVLAKDHRANHAADVIIRPYP